MAEASWLDLELLLACLPRAILEEVGVAEVFGTGRGRGPDIRVFWSLGLQI